MPTLKEKLARIAAGLSDKEFVYKKVFSTFTYRADGGYLPYDPSVNPAQDAFHTAAREGKRYLALFGGSGLGKSMCAAREASLHIFKPGSTVWLVGADYESASKEFEYCWNDFVMAANKDGERIYEAALERAVNNPKNGDMHIKFKWGSEIVGKSAKNADDGSLLGEGVDCIVLCEGSRIPEGVFKKYLERAISRREGRVICNTTPKGKNWVYHKFFKPAMEGNPLYWSAEPFPAYINPFYSKEEYERQKEELGEESPEFQEQFMGKFVSYSGICYPEFKVYGDDRHVFDIDPTRDIPETWPRWLVCDPHFSIPHAVGFYTVDRNDCPIIYDELWVGGSADNLVESIVEKFKQHGARIVEGDAIRLPDGREAREIIALFGGNPVIQIIDTSSIVKSDLHGGTSMCDEILAAGLRFKTARKEGIEARILKLKRKLKERVPVFGKEDKTKPWLMVASHCHNHIREFEEAEWYEYSSRSDKTPKQQRKDRNDHYLNCFEYFLAENPTWDIFKRDQLYRPSQGWSRTTIEQAVEARRISRRAERPWRERGYALRS